MKAKDLAIVAGAYNYYLLQGASGTESILLEALNAYGSRGMAVAFLNCGNEQLEQAVRDWAWNNAYSIYSVPGGLAVRWGRG